MIYLNSDHSIYTGLYANYQWFSSLGKIEGETQYFINVPYTDDFYVEVKDQNGCTKTSEPFHAEFYESGIKKVNNKILMNYNPADKSVIMETLFAGKKVVKIYDLAAKLIYYSVIFEKNYIIDFDFVPQGIYLYLIDFEGKVYSGKIAKY